MLTKYELEIMDLLVLGYNNKEISNKLIITSQKTKTIIASIYQKLGVKNRVQATIKYISLMQ